MLIDMWEGNQQNPDLKFLRTCHLASSITNKCERKIGTEEEHFPKEN